jgi:signal transduction histidine kinase
VVPTRRCAGRVAGAAPARRRENLDPYRDADRRELQRFIDATALAFANSAAYHDLGQSRESVRRLLEQVQEAQSTTAQTIARELHDEVININLRLNIEAVQRLLATPPADPGELHRELALILEGERTTIEALRLVCNDLDPLGYNDPYGFAVALRLLVERMEPLWNVPITLQVQGQPLAIPSSTQRQVIRVAREALANALKHAKASRITVTLCFPHELDDPIVLSVRDDGRTGQPIVPKPGHWGLRYMQEGVQTIGGRLAIETGADGTEVRVTFVG